MKYIVLIDKQSIKHKDIKESKRILSNSDIVCGINNYNSIIVIDNIKGVTSNELCIKK